MSHHTSYLEDWLEPLRIGPSCVRSLACQLSTTFNELALHSTDQFLATPITRLPTGQETGEYLAIDLGGTNLRIAFITLLGNSPDASNVQSEEAAKEFARDREAHVLVESILKSHGKSWPIGEHLKVEKAEDLFSWVGDCLAEVVEARFLHATKEQIPNEIRLGITFSFPMMYVRTSPFRSDIALTSLLPHTYT